jgi:hypothetical protein
MLIDPAIEAVERYKKAQAAYFEFGQSFAHETHPTPEVEALEKTFTELGEKSCDALYEMLSTTPTTVAGCAALLRQIEAFQIGYDEPIFSDWRGDISVAVRNLLSRIAATLEANA